MKIKGVNLGNWLVLEKWMSRSLFEGTDAEDEINLYKVLPINELKERLKVHRDSYITERDFAIIASKGLNAVRIPVPYFIFGDCVPYIGCIEYLDKAFNWAEKYGVKILIDLHTVPDSQNGFDNGGISGVCKWAQDSTKVEFALTVLERLAERYKNRVGLFGIEILNEPISEELWNLADVPSRYPAVDKEYAKGSKPISSEFLREFYTNAYRRIRQYLGEEKAIVFHDGFRMKEWKDFIKESEFKNVILDTHFYLMMLDATGGNNMDSYTHFIENVLAKDIEAVQEYIPVIVGEWNIFSCAEELKSSTDEEKRSFYRKLAKFQTDQWEKGAGWFYWSYKLLIDTVHIPELEGWDSWDMGKCMDMGWFPIG